MSFARAVVKNYPNEYYWWNLLSKDNGTGAVYSASFSCNNLITEVLMYDEADMTGIDENEKTINKAVNYLPLAYRDEFKKDAKKYTAQYLKSKYMYLVKQYGDVYVHYCWWKFDQKTVIYFIYPAKPSSKDITFLVAKPNPKYTQ